VRPVSPQVQPAGPARRTNVPAIPPVQPSKTIPMNPVNPGVPSPVQGAPQAAPPPPPAAARNPLPPPAPPARPSSPPKLPFAKTEPAVARPPSVKPPPIPAGPRASSPPPADGGESRAPRSTRPTAAWDLQAQPEQQSIADTFAALLNDVDASFGSLQMQKGDSQRPGAKVAGLSGVGLSDVRELFSELAANHMRQVRDFMIDVKWGEATRDWALVCEPALRSLRRAADKLDLADLCHALDDYRAALEKVAAGQERVLSKSTRDLLIESYGKLLEIMPQAFALEIDRTQREAVIVQSLLLQVPDVRKVTIDKLYAAGLNSLEVIFAARADDIAATTGIPERLAERIVEKVQLYRKELAAAVPDAARSSERERLAQLAKELKRQHLEYEQAAAGWSEDASVKKRYLRGARDETLLQIKVLLARLGEVDRVGLIERLPFQKKIENIEGFLAEASEMYVPQ
jgi:hypothetical protein